MRQYETKVGGVYYFRRVVPDDLVGAFTTANGKPRTEWKISTRTKDRAAARPVLRKLEADTDRLITDARAALGKQPPPPTAIPSPLPMRITSAELEAIERNDWEAAQATYEQMCDDDAREEADPAFAAQRTLRRAAARLERDREDLRLIGEAKRESAAANRIGIMELFDRYADVPGRHPKTVAQWRTYFDKLIEFVGHDDAARLTFEELRSWRNHLRDVATFRGKRLSAKTINGSYLAAVKVVLGWAADDGTLPSNPSAELKPVSAPAKPVTRSRVMSEPEAQTVLRAALASTDGSMANARRWLPWLMCHSGARVGEVAQLRKGDVRDIGGVPCMCLTPDAGSIKSRKARNVPLHPDLIARGFLEFVESRPDGPLFFDPDKRRSDHAINRQANKVGSNLAAWVRGLGVNPPQPNHAWRHRFVTLAARYELPERASAAICGHAQQGQHRAYGDDELDVLMRELSKLPAVDLTLRSPPRTL